MTDVLTRRAFSTIPGLPERQCTAMKHGGERCRKKPIPGGFVCHFHGGGSVQVRAAARERLMALVDPAIDALLRALKAGHPCTVCGRSDDMTVVLRAAQLVLDRTGYHPTVGIQPLPPPPSATYVGFMPADRLQQIGVWIAEAKDLEARHGN